MVHERLVLGGLFNPAALSYPEALYFDPRLQSMLRSNPHAALYSQLASPYASHLYGMMPGGPPNLSGLHERMKLEEEHRARIQREEEKARIAREEEKARERERELREKEMREREMREKEMREREQREKEMRELREKEMREREQRDKELRERDMREKERREHEKLLQQHHYMQSQARNNPFLMGLFPQMVGLRPPGSMHPGYPMHPSLLGLTHPSQIPTSLSNSLNLPHHSQSQQTGSSSSPITSSPSMSLMSQIGSSGSLMGLNPAHGLPHGLSMFPGNLPPPAHLYSPLAPPSASPSSLSNSSYSHAMMTNPRSSPQPVSRSPLNSAQQSLNLSKNQLPSAQYSSKDHRSEKPVTTSAPTPSVATVSVTSMINEKNFKIEIPNISNGSNGNKNGPPKSEVKDLSSSVKIEDKPKEEKLSPLDNMKPVIIEKSSIESVKAVDNEKSDESPVKIEDDIKIKAEHSPQDFSSLKNVDLKDVKVEADDKQLGSNDNDIAEVEKKEGSGDSAMDESKDDSKADDKPSIKDESIDENNGTKTNEASKTSSKK